MGRLRTRRLLAILGTAFLALATSGCVQRYVALGDSYTAGPVIPVQQHNAQIPGGCLQSDHNYPHLVAPELHLPQFADASCSGAKTDDMTSPQDVEFGPNPPQFDRLTRDTMVVTLGIGGNDIGFTEIATTCGQGGIQDPNGTPCQDTYVVNGTDQISERIAAMAPKLRAVLDGIHTRAPQAKVFVVGYPSILPDTGNGCFPVMPIAPGDVPYVRDKEKELNATIQAVTVGRGDVFVDTYTPSLGHDACQLPTVKWVEPVAPTEPAAPVHPNARGEAGMAAAVLDAMRANGVVPQPAQTVSN
jgi:lysophospholipase L1-like esterase